MSIVNKKKVALSVFFLNDKDREWVYSRLSEDEVKKLNQSLDELNELGISRDANVKELIFKHNNIEFDDEFYVVLKKVIDKKIDALFDFLINESSMCLLFLQYKYPALFNYEFKNNLSRKQQKQLKKHMLQSQLSLTDRAEKALENILKAKIFQLSENSKINEQKFNDVLLDLSTDKSIMEYK
ncbi:MAG: hypothetical protein OQL19_22185 [Gammaproteobacteria bacterium]|nr:hypothetical protein [Gammaproteobacteria bacterium]